MAGCVFPVSEAIRAHHGPNSCTKIVDYALVDAFTDVAFKGNPAVVCLLPRFSDEKWMQNVAAEFSAPMTAFLVKREAFSNHENGISEGANANGAIKCECICHTIIREFHITFLVNKNKIECPHCNLLPASAKIAHVALNEGFIILAGSPIPVATLDEF